MQDTQIAFHQEEYKQVRTEVVGLLAKIDQFFRFSVIVPTGVYSWLLTSAFGVHTLPAGAQPSLCLKLPLPLILVAWSIPPMFVFFCGLMSLAFSVRISQFGQYLLRLEGALGDSKLGWEKFNVPIAPRLTWIHKLAWAALFLICLASSLTGVVQAIGNAQLCAAAK